MLFLVVLLVLYIKHRLTRMPIGRAWEALREDEIACRSLGLNHVLVKLSAFMLGASTAGLAGYFSPPIRASSTRPRSPSSSRR